MVVELNEKMIQDAFAKTGIDQKYYPQYEAEAKRRYETLQKEDPDYEESPDEDNAHSSISLTNKYIVYYVDEIEKGHCQQWAHSYAKNSVWGGKEDNIVQETLDSLNEDVKGEELKTHAKSINDDPIFVEYYINCFEQVSEPRVIAEAFCRAYHNSIVQGRSLCYAKNYAELASSGEYVDDYCSLYAETCDYADKHGVKDKPSVFAYRCAEAYLSEGILGIVHLKSSCKEGWQQDYLSALYDKLIEEQEARRK